MVKLQRGLLVALVLICALTATTWGVKAHAASSRSGVVTQSLARIGPSTEGEPDTGQTKDPPKVPNPTPSYDPTAKRWAPTWYQQQIRWMRLTSGILSARYLGVLLRF